MYDKLFELIEIKHSDLTSEALFDGYRQNTEILERIDKEVSKQE